MVYIKIPLDTKCLTFTLKYQFNIHKNIICNYLNYDEDI